MNINVNDTRFGALTLANTQKKSAAESYQEKMFSNIFDSDGEMDMNKMMGAYFKMNMMQSMMSNPMMAAYMTKMMGMDSSPTTDKVDFSNTRTNVMDQNQDYVNEDGLVSDIESPAQSLKKDERKKAENALFANAPKESIALFEKNADGSHDTNNNLATQLKEQGYDDIISDNKVDSDKIKEEYKKTKEETKGKINHEGTNSLLDGELEGQKLDDVAEQLGLDTAGDPGSTAGDTYVSGGLGKKQQDELEGLGIIKNGTIQEIKKGSEAEKYLTNLQSSHEKKELLEKVKDADVYVQTGETDATKGDATYTKAEVNGKGDIEKLDKKAIVKADGQDEIAGPQLKLDGIDDEKMLKKITTVGKDGSVELDLTKLDGEEYAQLNEKGITYSGSSALKIKGREVGEAVQVNVTGDAKNVELEGGVFNIKTENDALKIKADANSTIKDVKGADLKHLVIDGGNVDAEMDKLGNLEALKIQNSKIKELKLCTDGDLAVNLDNITSDTDMAISAGQDAQIQIKNSKIKNLAVTGENGDARVDLQGTTAKDVNITADENHTAIFGGDAKTKAEAIKLDGQNAIVSANGMEAKSIDASAVTDGAGVFLAKGTKIKDGIEFNADTKDKNEIVVEDKNDKNLQKLSSNDNADARGMSQDDVFKYLGWSESKFKQIQANEKAKYANPYGTAYGAQAPQENEGWLKRGLKGFAMGTQMYNQNQMNSYGYQNQMNGYGYQNQMMGYQQQPYNPWMQNGQFGWNG